MIFEIIIAILSIYLIIKIHDAIDILLRIRFLLSDIIRFVADIRDFESKTAEARKKEANAKELEAMSQFIKHNITPFMGSIFEDSESGLKEKAEKIKNNKKKK